MTVGDGDSSNAGPVAVGTIPDHSVGVGGTVNVDVTGYFSDADGDELSYMASSSNADVATASIEGTTVMIEGVGAGSTVVTVTASDGQATAAQGFNVTVAAAPPNNPPVAVGTIPGSRLQIGGTSTLDVAGYFSDADGDELTYTGSSSNEAVAMVAMEGSTATISAIAAGDAVITITASDGSASVSQGFRIDVPTGPEEATVVITRLLDANRQTIGDPTDLAGTIYVELEVESNDETWTDIGLTLNGETVTPQCRGSSSSADGVPGPGLAAARGQVPVECILETTRLEVDDLLDLPKNDRCQGMQLMPKYLNGEYELSAYLVVVGDEDRREAVATQQIALNNSNYMIIDHNDERPGLEKRVVSGETFYGGPTTEDNVNTFDVCPVAFDETVVGAVHLRAMTDTQDAPSLSFRSHGNRAYGTYWGARRRDSEAPFTFTAHSDWNGRNRLADNGVEDIPNDDNGGHWIIQDGDVFDPDDVEISDRFVPGDPENDLTKIGPIFFDFNAPRVDSEATQVKYLRRNSWVSFAEGNYYSGKRNTYDGRAQALWAHPAPDYGVGSTSGGVSQTISVGDCSVRANTDTGRDGAGTPFQPIEGYENVGAIGSLAEEDPSNDPLTEDGGVECYTAELQDISDRLGNSRSLSTTRIQSAAVFGVDKTQPVLDNIEPDETELVLAGDAELVIDISDPELATGELGSGIDVTKIQAYWGPSTTYDDRYFEAFANAEGSPIAADESSVRIATTTGNPEGDKERAYTVVVEVHDRATPANVAGHVFRYVRDATPPSFSVSKSQADIGRTQAPSVTASVGGTISDGNVIKTAELTIRSVTGPSGEGCTNADNELTQGRNQQVNRNARNLDNDTNRITFDEAFVIAKDEGMKWYCFFLEVADVAVGSDGRGGGNQPDDGGYEVGVFSVNWPAGPPPTPTYELAFTDADGDAVTMLEVNEGSGTDGGSEYMVALSAWPDDAADDAEVTVAIAVAEANRAVYAVLSENELTFDASNFSTAQAVTVTTLDHDDNADAEAFTLTHTPSGLSNFAAANVAGMVNDDDIALSVSGMPNRFGENDSDSVAVTIMATTGVADPQNANDNNTNRTFTVTLGTGDANDVTWYSDEAATATTITEVELALEPGATMVETTIYIRSADDAVQDEGMEEIPVTGGTVSGGYINDDGDTNTPTAPVEVNVEATNIVLHDDDPDITIVANHKRVDEGAGETAVTVTVTESDGRMVNFNRTVTVTVAAPSGRASATSSTTRLLP